MMPLKALMLDASRFSHGYTSPDIEALGENAQILRADPNPGAWESLKAVRSALRYFLRAFFLDPGALAAFASLARLNDFWLLH